VDGTAPRFRFTDPVPSLAELGRVHLIAIGGAGMSAVARLLLAHGVPVSGSDAADGPALASLRENGARVHVGHDPAHLRGADTVVISSAIRDDNVELAAAREAGLRVLHRAQALAVLMAPARRVAIAGANGKTTTTSMLTVGLIAAGLDPSFACGGEIAQLGTNAAVGHGDVFVVEADESDGSFLAYRPHVAVVTNVQADHLDFHGTVAGIESAYAAFRDTIVEGGTLVVCLDDPGARVLGEGASRGGLHVMTYGFHEDADLRVLSTTAHGLGSSSVLRHGGIRHDLELRVPGDHNVLDACAAFLAAVVGLGAEPSAVLRGLAGFTGARRRFEVRGEVMGVTVVDDYAHNPAKVSAVVRTASAVARRGGGALHVIFQPHLYSRTRDFATEFAHALAPADHVVVLDVYGAREQPLPGVSSDLVGDVLAALPGERSLVVRPTREEAVASTARAARPGDMVLVVGAGDVTTLVPGILGALEEHRGGGSR
jgi:UDP-N-acetylmuramate--alanine ligase